MKKKLQFLKICWVLVPFWKKQCFWKMGMAGIKRPCPSTVPSFLVNLNEEGLLIVSFKNTEWFQICPFSKTTAFSKKALKPTNFEKLEFFFHFLWQFYRVFQWYIVCFHTFSVDTQKETPEFYVRKIFRPPL